MNDKRDEYAESKEADDVTNDDYFSRLTPGHNERRESLLGMRKASSNAIGVESDGDSDVPPVPELNESGPEGTWHSSVGKHPILVRPGVRPKSKEGLLNDFLGSGSELPSPEAGNSPIEGEEAPPEIRRATSVDLGKGHVRHISAGSAKLLHLPRRTSVDSKRLSSGSTATSGVLTTDSVKEEAHS
jgi:hypothetical protein